jgi:tetratricopeptide (TPR) repeat protein
VVVTQTPPEGFGMPELDPAVHERIQALCAQGDALAENDRFPAALKKYWAAWDLLPEPRTAWEAATWILGAIGDANFLGGDFAAGRDNLTHAMHCPDAVGNPFLHLRLGQCLYELGELDRAADELTRAYTTGGAEVFEDAEEYFAFLRTRLAPPAGGW